MTPYPLGWFALYDDDPDVSSNCHWQPALQLEGYQATIDTYFLTEADCLGFIEREVLGKGMHPHHAVRT